MGGLGALHLFAPAGQGSRTGNYVQEPCTAQYEHRRSTLGITQSVRKQREKQLKRLPYLGLLFT